MIELYGEEKLVEEGFDLEAIRTDYNGIPKNDYEKAFVEKLAEVATKTAINRHVGSIRYVYGPSGRGTLAQGKDLSNVQYVIGTGGALTQLENGRDILSSIKASKDSLQMLPKSEPVILLDHDYIMSSLGVLSLKHERFAMELLAKSLRYQPLSDALDEEIDNFPLEDEEGKD